MVMKSSGNFIVLLVFILLLTSCGSNEKKRQEIVRPVKTTTIGKIEKNSTREFTGKVKEAAEIKLAFRISGPIHKLPVKEGKFVKKGDLIAEIDPRDYRVQLASAEANLKQLTAETERITTLYKKRRIARNSYEKMVAARDIAKSQYKSAKNSLKDTKLRAPFSGYIQEKYFENNEIVEAGRPVVSIVNLEYLEVETEIPSSLYIKRDTIKGYSCTLSTIPDKVFFLELVNIRKKANHNQLYKVILRMAPEGEIRPAPGMTADIRIEVAESSNSIEIPVEALFNRDGSTCVWLYSEAKSTVEPIKVEAGSINSLGEVKILSGLKSGMKIVTAGVNSLKENQKVSLLTEAPETNVGQLL